MAGGKVIGGAFTKAGCHGPKAFQAVDGAFNLVSLFVDVGVMVQLDEAVFFTGNHGGGPGLLNLGAHVARVVGSVGQHGLARAQVAPQQARRLRAVARLAAGQGQGANPAVGVATQVELGRKTALPGTTPAAAERLPDGAVFFLAPAATWWARTAVESTSSTPGSFILS